MDFHSLVLDENSVIRRHWVPFSLGFLGLMFLVGGLIWSSVSGSSLAGSKHSEGIIFESGQDVKGATVSAASDGIKITIDVEGAVAKPGVYQLPNTGRVQDAVNAAGGLSSDADKEWVAKRMNMASKLSDGIKVYIPALGEAPVQATTGSVGSLSTGEGLININSASESQLDSLPGIGSVTAGKIIKARPYGSIEELLQKKIVSTKVFDQIKEKIAAN